MEKNISKKRMAGKFAIKLAAMFVISLLFSRYLDLIGNVIISLICGIAANDGKLGLKKTTMFFSFLAVLEVTTLLCLTVFPLGSWSFDSTLIVIGLSFSALLFVIGWAIGKIWPW